MEFMRDTLLGLEKEKKEEDRRNLKGSISAINELIKYFNSVK
jgi:hypothetical protein